MTSERLTQRLLKYFRPPVFDIEERTLRARTLHRVVWSAIGIATFFVLALVVTQPATAGRRAQTIVVLAGAWLICLEISRRGQTRLASWLVIGTLTALMAQRSVTSGGISAPSATSFVIIVLLAGLLLGTRGGIVAAITCAAIGFAMVAMDWMDVLPPSELTFTPFVTWVFNCMWLGLALVLQHQVASALGYALDRANTQLAERRQTQRRLRLALEAGKIGTWQQDIETRRMTADPRLFALYAIPLTQDLSVPFETWAGRVHPDDLPAAKAVLDEARKGATDLSSEFRIVRPDGTIRHVAAAVTSASDESGRPNRVVGVNIDVTVAREAERERNHLVHDLGERVKELRLLHDAARLLHSGRPSDRALFEELVRMIPGAWQYPAVCEARISYRDMVASTSAWRDSEWKQTAHFSTSDGTGFVEVVYLAPTSPEAEGPFLLEERKLLDSLAEMIVGYVELRRHREGLEQLVAMRTEQLRAAKDEAERANRAKSTFLATMTHEIRTPMNAILGYAQLLRRDRSLGDNQQHKIDVILTSGEHLLELISNVLEMSRIEAGRTKLVKEVVNLRALLDTIEQMFVLIARGKGVDLSFEQADGLPAMIEGDSGKIRQVVINLLSNAAKFTERGRISLRASAERTEHGVHVVTIVVQDTGTGIDAESLTRIFTAFEQATDGAKAGGTGLGLTISRELAQLMGGDVTAISTVGSGSTFTFTFEAGELAEAATPHAGASGLPTRLEANKGSRKILVADDLERNREAVDELLRAVGFETRLAVSGEEAIEAHNAWQPDLVLMDMRMPGIGGLEAIRRLREAGSKAVLLVFTASGFEHLDRDAHAVGADGVVLKPYREAELLHKIGDFLGVRYVYEATQPTTAPSRASAVAEVLPALLTTVPPALIAQLRDAVLEAGAARIELLAEQVGQHSPVAAAQIRSLARDFRYDKLAAALDAVSRE